MFQFSRSVVSDSATQWTVALQVSLSISNQSLLTLMSIKSVMPSNHLILCRPLLLPSSIFPSIKIFSTESALHIRYSKYWSFSFSISPSSEYSGLMFFRIDWFHLLTVQDKCIFLFILDFPRGSEVKVSACNAEDLGSIPGSGRSPGEGNGNPLQYSCLENPMDGRAWWATVHGVTKSWTQLN